MGKSRLRDTKEDFQIHEFSEDTTLKSIFLPEEEESSQAIVYMRHPLDFSAKTSMPGQKKDEVLEENLLDVKRLLKNSTKGGSAGDPAKKQLVNMTGVEPYYKKQGDGDRTLIFESRFESGNLAAALKVSDGEYHLLLQNDVNTGGHTQWFFFRVQNTKAGSKVRFNMLNLVTLSPKLSLIVKA